MQFLKTVFTSLVITLSLVDASPVEKGNAVSSDDVETILFVHNKYRALHGSEPLGWNNTLAAYANQWSRKCIVNHSGSEYGENIAGRTLSWVQTVDAWYEEEEKYNYKHPGYNYNTGHFAQVVWRNTQFVGCAVSYCDNIKANLYVCEYEPRGDVISSNGDPAAYYRTNITEPIDTKINNK